MVRRMLKIALLEIQEERKQEMLECCKVSFTEWMPMGILTR